MQENTSSYPCSRMDLSPYDCTSGRTPMIRWQCGMIMSKNFLKRITIINIKLPFLVRVVRHSFSPPHDTQGGLLSSDMHPSVDFPPARPCLLTLGPPSPPARPCLPTPLLPLDHVFSPFEHQTNFPKKSKLSSSSGTNRVLKNDC